MDYEVPSFLIHPACNVPVLVQVEVLEAVSALIALAYKQRRCSGFFVDGSAPMLDK
jgi:hypothetical protein